LFGYFILGKQNKVTRQQGEKQCLAKERTKMAKQEI